MGIVALVSVLSQETGQCDNIAGTCLRRRQEFAIYTVQAAVVAAVLVPALGFVLAVVRRRLRTLAVLGIFVAAVVSAAVLAVDPLAHLNNRWTGWFA